MSDEDDPSDDGGETPPKGTTPIEIRRIDRSAPVRRLERELEPRDFAIAQRVYAAIKADQDSANEELQQTVGAAIAQQAEKVARLERSEAKQSLTLHDLKRTDKLTSRLAWGAPAIALAIAAYVARQIWSGSEEVTTIRLELKYTVESIRRLEHELERVRPDMPKASP